MSRTRNTRSIERREDRSATTDVSYSASHSRTCASASRIEPCDRLSTGDRHLRAQQSQDQDTPARTGRLREAARRQHADRDGRENRRPGVRRLVRRVLAPHVRRVAQPAVSTSPTGECRHTLFPEAGSTFGKVLGARGESARECLKNRRRRAVGRCTDELLACAATAIGAPPSKPATRSSVAVSRSAAEATSDTNPQSKAV